jgi:hypothetical protein
MVPFRGGSARRAVLALLCAALSFAVLQAGLGVAIEHGLPGVRDPEYAFKIERLRARLAEAPGRPLVLVLGSSRVQMGLDAARVRASLGGRPALVFNFGMSGGGALLDAVFLRRLRADGVRPDLLVLEVLPPTLNQPGAYALEEDWLNGARLRAAELAFVNRFHTEPRRAWRQWAKGRGLPCYWGHDDLRSNLALDTRDPATRPERILGTMDGLGWRPYSQEDVAPERRAWLAQLARRQYNNALGEFRLAPGPARALRETVARCRQDGLPLALLLMPEGASFRALYPPSMRAGIDRHLAGLCREWDLPLIDARLWMDDDAFWDGHHLLPRGAAAFSARFEHEALAPLLRSLPDGSFSTGPRPR